MIFKIAAKELRLLFLSPLAWAILAIVQFIVAFIFLDKLENYYLSLPELVKHANPPGLSLMVAAQMFGEFAVLLLVIVPLITMRIICGEHRTNTMVLLTSAPLTISDIVLGKFLGAFGFLLIMLLMLLVMPLSLMSIGHIDIGILLSGVFGLSLLLCGFTAVGIYMSSLVRQPTIAAMSTFGILLLLWVVGLAGSAGAPDALTNYISMMNHYQAFLRGIFSSADVFYFLLISITFIVLTIRRLDALRLHQ